MRIGSSDIPQANTFEDVVRTVLGVAAGSRTDSEIGIYVGKGARQGRYYRRAAEIIGLINNGPRTNYSVLTTKGVAFVEAKEIARQPLLIEAVLSARLFQRVIPFLEAKGTVGALLGDLDAFIAAVTEPVGASMIPRRRSTVVSWLSAIGLVQVQNGRVSISQNVPSMSAVEYDAVDEPLVPATYGLQEYQNVSSVVARSHEAIQIKVNTAALERANVAHTHLVNCVANKLRNHGSIPRFSRLVDLAANIAGIPFLFEMKSTNLGNFRSQFRRAVSQLYEYRYIQRANDAKLVVILENPPGREDAWLLDYGVQDRGLLIAWNGNGEILSAANGCEETLGFLL